MYVKNTPTSLLEAFVLFSVTNSQGEENSPRLIINLTAEIVSQSSSTFSGASEFSSLFFPGSGS